MTHSNTYYNTSLIDNFLMLGLFSDNSHKDSTMIHLLTYVAITCVDFDNMAIIYTNTHRYIYIKSSTIQPACVVLWSPLLSFKLGGQGSSLGRTSTQGFKISEEKGLSALTSVNG